MSATAAGQTPDASKAEASTTEHPAWFRDAIAQEPEIGRFEVRGSTINALTWGSRRSPTLVLVHGGSAHAHWWNFIAPLLAEQHRVVAVDLSGHGDSGHRETYSADVWAEEIMTAAAEVGGTDRPIVAGHSMGGRVTSLVAARYGVELAGAIIMDTRLRRNDPETDDARSRPASNRTLKIYPDLETAVKRFRLLPAQECENQWLLDHVARYSLRQVDGGWTWKFDPRLFSEEAGPPRSQDFAPGFEGAACRVAVVRGKWSAIADEDTRNYMLELLASSPGSGRGVPFVEIPEARHHLMFDRPLELFTALQGIVATWRAA